MCPMDVSTRLKWPKVKMGGKAHISQNNNEHWSTGNEAKWISAVAGILSDAILNLYDKSRFRFLFLNFLHSS